MFGRRSYVFAAFFAVLGLLQGTAAFQPPGVIPPRPKKTTAGSLNVFGKKKNRPSKEDLSYIESRDMTREEMEDLNRQNEEIMNAELVGMTAFSLIISLPLLYLAWVGLFSETAEIAMD